MEKTSELMAALMPAQNGNGFLDVIIIPVKQALKSPTYPIRKIYYLDITLGGSGD